MVHVTFAQMMLFLASMIAGPVGGFAALVYIAPHVSGPIAGLLALACIAWAWALPLAACTDVARDWCDRISAEDHEGLQTAVIITVNVGGLLALLLLG